MPRDVLPIEPGYSRELTERRRSDVRRVEIIRRSRIRRVRLERVGDVHRLDSTVAEDRREDVEPDIDSAGAAIGHPPRRKPANPALLAPSHRLGGGAEAIRAPGLDLAENEERAPADDEVELTTRPAMVPLDHGEPKPAEIVGGEIFSGAAQHLRCVHAHNASDRV